MRISVDEVIDAVCKFYRLEKAELLSVRQHHFVSHPRQMAWTLCREFTDASLTRIGLRFHRDHTTIMVGLRSLKYRIKDQAQERAELEHLRIVMRNRSSWDFDQAYDQAWRTWAFVHRQQATL